METTVTADAQADHRRCDACIFYFFYFLSRFCVVLAYVLLRAWTRYWFRTIDAKERKFSWASSSFMAERGCCIFDQKKTLVAFVQYSIYSVECQNVDYLLLLLIPNDILCWYWWGWCLSASVISSVACIVRGFFSWVVVLPERWWCELQWFQVSGHNNWREGHYDAYLVISCYLFPLWIFVCRESFSLCWEEGWAKGPPLGINSHFMGHVLAVRGNFISFLHFTFKEKLTIERTCKKRAKHTCWWRDVRVSAYFMYFVRTVGRGDFAYMIGCTSSALIPAKNPCHGEWCSVRSEHSTCMIGLSVYRTTVMSIVTQKSY